MQRLSISPTIRHLSVRNRKSLTVTQPQPKAYPMVPQYRAASTWGTAPSLPKDVSGMSAGQTVKCPCTDKLFKVPPTQQAANSVEARLEPKAEALKLSEETKAEDKKP